MVHHFYNDFRSGKYCEGTIFPLKRQESIDFMTAWCRDVFSVSMATDLNDKYALHDPSSQLSTLTNNTL